MNVLGFGTYDRIKHPRIGILLDGLSQLGDQVHELNAPLGFSTAERVAMLNKPQLGYRFALRLLRRWLELVIGRSRIRRQDRPDAVIVGYLGHFDVILAWLLFPRTYLVLDLLIFAADTATDRGVHSRGRLRILAGLDRLAIRCANLVVVDTEENAELLSERQRGKAVVASVGSPDEWFATPASSSTDPTAPLQAVFFGLYTPLQGATVIGQAISQLAPDTPITITMIGTGQDLAATKRLAGAAGAAAVTAGAAAGTKATASANGVVVRWLDWAEPAQLRDIVARSQLCLGIFGATAKGLRVTPNKVYQGAAAGCAILTSDTAPQRRALGNAAVYVRPGDAGALADALSSLAANPEEVSRLRTAANARAEQRFRSIQVAQPVQAAILRAT